MQSLRNISLPVEFENGIFIMGSTVFWFDKLKVYLENGFLTVELESIPCFYNLKENRQLTNSVQNKGSTRFRITNQKTRLWVFRPEDSLDSVIAKFIEGRKLTPVRRMSVYEIVYTFGEIRKLKKCRQIKG